MAELLSRTENVELNQKPADSLEPKQEGTQELDIDRDLLVKTFMEDFKNDIQDKEGMGWVSKREYDIKSYYQQKEELWKWTPWKGASAYRSPLTATLLDTGLASMQQSIFSEGSGPVQVKPTGAEDIRTSRILELYLNNLVDTESQLEQASDMNIFRMFLTGTGILKVKRTLGDTGVECVSIDAENIFVPLGAKGFKKDQTDHVIHIIPLTKSELNYRKLMGVYEGIENVQSGVGYGDTAKDAVTQVVDKSAGSSMDQYRNREIYYVAEYYKTFWNEEEKRPIELVAWIAPNGGQLLRVKENKEKIRPFSRHVIYEHEDQRFYGISLPEKIREIQEKLDYSDKQLTDAMDKANLPAMFIDDTSGFDANMNQRVPGGVYQVGVGRQIDYEPVPHVERGFDKERFDLWSSAERLTGLIDVVQGASTVSGRTLGETEIRTQSATTRFKSLIKRYEKGFNDTLQIIFQYQNLYVPREKKVNLIGYEDYKTIDEVFMSGPDQDQQQFYGLRLESNYNFVFSNKTPIEKQDDLINSDMLYDRAMSNPVAQNPAAAWNLLEDWAKKHNIRNLDSLVFKPKESNLLPATEFIKRVLAGQYGLQMRPGIAYEEYMFEIQLYMKSEQFQLANPKVQQTLTQALQIADTMLKAQKKAQMDMMLVKDYIDKRNNIDLALKDEGIAPKGAEPLPNEEGRGLQTPEVEAEMIGQPPDDQRI